MISPSNLPARTSDAPLPQTYEQAKQALATCDVIDECQNWADKTAALASYARQQNDETLMRFAMRIRARATRRVGELLKQFDGRGGDQKGESDGGGTFDIRPPTQRMAAESAGLSKRQQVTAVRVANIPEKDFEAAVESPFAPTITKLAEAGKRPAPFDPILHAPKPDGFNEAIHTMGAMRRFADKCREHRPELIAGALAPYEVTEARELVALLDSWLDRFVVNLKG